MVSSPCLLPYPHATLNTPMRKLQISIFSRAADAHATRQTLTFEELIEDFRAPEICEDSATEAAASALKLEAPAWSSSCFRNDHRAKEDFISASCLVYDLDISKESGAAVFRNLFQKADEYDDFLKKEYSCLDRLEE